MIFLLGKPKIFNKSKRPKQNKRINTPDPIILAKSFDQF